MRRPWEPEIDLDAMLASRLIGEQFPALAAHAVEPLGSGWDNAAYLVGEELVFRFPRRQAAAHLLANEALVLPLVAPHLPLPVPLPRFLGRPCAAYPFAFSGAPLVAGKTAETCHLDAEGRAALAAALGGFLRALHAVPLAADAAAWAPGDELRKTDVAGRAPQLARDIAKLAAWLPASEVRRLELGLQGLVASFEPATRHTWVHGDFYALHLVLADAVPGHPPRLAGVIDWGDVHRGDPAVDLSIGFSFLPPPARAAFRAAYGEIDAAAWERARFRGLHYGVVLAAYGREAARPEVAAVGDFALRNALLDP